MQICPCTVILLSNYLCIYISAYTNSLFSKEDFFMNLEWNSISISLLSFLLSHITSYPFLCPQLSYASSLTPSFPLTLFHSIFLLCPSLFPNQLSYDLCWKLVYLEYSVISHYRKTLCPRGSIIPSAQSLYDENLKFMKHTIQN